MACLLCTAGLASAGAQTFVSETPQTRKVLLEEYTGIRCANCPEGHKIAAQIVAEYPQEVFLMNIHGTALAIPQENEIDLRTTYGDALIELAGTTNIPSGSLNRHHFNDAENTVLYRNDWEPHIQEILAMPSYVNIAAKASLDWQTRLLSVRVQLYYTQQPEAISNFIHVAVVQDSIAGAQNGTFFNSSQVLPDGRYLHLHAFRDFLSGQWGEETSIQTGQVIEKTFTKTMPEQIGNVDLNFKNLQIIAFVSENKEEIINVCQAEVEDVNRPACFAALSAPRQIEQASCDKGVRFSLELKNHPLSEKSIHKITYACIGEKNKEEYVYEPAEPVQPGEIIRFETPVFNLRKANTLEKVNFRLLSVNDTSFSDQTMFPVATEAIKYYGITENPDITMQVIQDRFGTDITWVLKDGNNDTVASDGPYENLPSKGEIQHDYTLTVSEGCHTFTIYDNRHDGINNGAGNGAIRFLEKDDRVFINHNGVYTDSAVITFQIGKIEPDEPDDPDTLAILPHQQPRVLHVYPNPCKDVLHIELTNTGETLLHVRLFSITGREVMHMRGSVNRIDVGKIPSGLYLIEARTTKGVHHAKLQLR